MTRMAKQANAPVPGTYQIDTGTASLERDHYGDSSWLLRVNGVQSSHVDLNDPLRLDFEYMRWMAAAINQWPAGPAPYRRILHLGGGACSMARWAAAKYPDSRQVVVELDGKLATYVREWFDLPKAPLLRIRVGDAAEVTPTLTDATRDIIIRDVFAGNKTPARVSSKEFATQIKRVLDPDGLYLANCGDTSKLEEVRRESQILSEVFEHVAMISDPAMFKGRRSGNVVFAASQRPFENLAALERDLRMDALPAQFRAV